MITRHPIYLCLFLEKIVLVSYFPPPSCYTNCTITNKKRKETEEVAIFFSSDIKDEPKDAIGDEYGSDKSAKMVLQPDDVNQKPGKVTGIKLPYNCNKCRTEFRSNTIVERQKSPLQSKTVQL